MIPLTLRTPPRYLLVFFRLYLPDEADDPLQTITKTGFFKGSSESLFFVCFVGLIHINMSDSELIFSPEATRLEQNKDFTEDRFYFQPLILSVLSTVL